MAGLYIHVPFCKRRCIYCDFYSTTEAEKKSTYIEALCKELVLRRDYLESEEIKTIYFGGGTPSLLDKADFQHIFTTIYNTYKVKNDAEITIEANPDDLSKEYLAVLAHFPFNRLSMGIQTFNDDMLKKLCRRHSSLQAIQAFQNCREAGFNNISIDLMYGLPGETVNDWEYDLQKATELKPEHISAYHLTYEEGTALWKLREQHKVVEASEDTSVAFFGRLIMHLKKNGYQHYEISNFCLPGCHSLHNSSYWTGEKYIGCGPSAHSYNRKSRQWNVASLDRYITSIDDGWLDYEIETLDTVTRYNDFVITTIRTCWGMPLQIVKEEFGEKLHDYCLTMAAPYLRKGMLEIVGNTLKLTEQGIFVSDGIMSDMLWVE